MDLLEEQLGSANNYAKGYMKMREVKDDLKQPVASQGQQAAIEDK